MAEAHAARSWPALGRRESARLWRGATIAALFAGYAGYYVCRSNLSVAGPLITRDPSLGVTSTTLGLIASAGVFAYAVGKPITGIAGDLLGGRRMFLGGMWGAVAATLLFGAAPGLTLIAVAWVLNRFVQSAGWGAMTRLVAQWFEAAGHGRVSATLSLSFLFGDAAARMLLGSLVDRGHGWRTVFVVSAAVLAVIAIGVAAVLREWPAERGLENPPPVETSVYGAGAGPDAPGRGVSGLVGPLLATSSFWLVCALSCGLTLVREAFNLWTPTFLATTYALPPGEAARWSAVFPLMGGLSVIGVGVAGDVLGPGRRMVVAAPMVLAAGACMALASTAVVASDFRLGVAVLAAIALCVIGPYSLLAGVMALEFGGQRGAATAAGLIDTAGYLGALLSGVAVGAAADAFGWSAAYRLLAVITVASAAVAGALAWRTRSVGPSTEHHTWT